MARSIQDEMWAIDLGGKWKTIDSWQRGGVKGKWKTKDKEIVDVWETDHKKGGTARTFWFHVFKCTFWSINLKLN